jgi:hypothetical protein
MGSSPISATKKIFIMATVLVIRKTDKTIHKVALENKARLMAFSNRLPEGQKWKFEEMDEKEADKLPFIDESYVTAAEAQDKAKELEGVVSEKDAKIAELEKLLAAKNAPAETAEPVIVKILSAENAEEVNKISEGDTRKGVIEAAAKKIASFEKK